MNVIPDGTVNYDALVAEEIPDTAATTLNAAYVNSTNDAGPVTIFGVINLSNGVDIAP